MLCCIGLVSEFEDKYPDVHVLYPQKITEIGLITMGVSNIEKDEVWVFVDRVAFLKWHSEYIIPMITRVLVHEIIHLHGYGEKIARSGEELVKYNDK